MERSGFGVPAGATAARLARHAEDLLAELFSLTPEARAKSEAELEQTLAALPPDYRTTFQLLRGDLAMIDGEEPPAASPAPPDVNERLSRAWMTKDWVAMLSLLRAAPQVQPEAKRAYGRGRAWAMLGYKRAAVPFFEHAANVEKNPVFFSALLDALHAAGRTEEAAVLAEPVLGDPHLIVALSAIRARFVAVPLRPVSTRAPEYVSLLAAIDRVLPAAHDAAAEHRAVFRSLLASAQVIRGFVLDHLARHDEADAAFGEAISTDDNVSTRVARGMHRVVHGGDARADLEMAVESDVPFVPAYLFLASLHLGAGDFANCQIVCERGLQWPADSAIEAALREMLGIALADRSEPDLVRAREELERAAALAPNDPRIKANLEALGGVTGRLALRFVAPELSSLRAAASPGAEAVSMALAA
jgi:tetratricopeptide (TPR) repeat protein